MKYPKAVYRIGNEFEKNEFIGETRAYYITQSGNERGKYTLQAFRGGGGYRFWNDMELVGITAETLAELSCDNAESVIWNPEMEEVAIEFGVLQSQKYRQKENEPLGEFFLRVAIERNYIKPKKA